MEISEYTEQKSMFLTADDLESIGTIWTIIGEGSMVEDKFNPDKLKLHLPISCDNEDKLFSCNKTNARTIEESLESDTKKWIGKKLKVGTYKQSIEGKMRQILIIDEVVLK